MAPRLHATMFPTVGDLFKSPLREESIEGRPQPTQRDCDFMGPFADDDTTPPGIAERKASRVPRPFKFLDRDQDQQLMGRRPEFARGGDFIAGWGVRSRFHDEVG